jgi:hypothetical protein
MLDSLFEQEALYNLVSSASFSFIKIVLASNMTFDNVIRYNLGGMVG